MSGTKRQLKLEHLRCVRLALLPKRELAASPSFAFRLLEQQALVEHLEGLCSEAFACTVGADDDKAAEKALRREGFQCARQVYNAAYDHLQVRHCEASACLCMLSLTLSTLACFCLLSLTLLPMLAGRKMQSTAAATNHFSSLRHSPNKQFSLRHKLPSTGRDCRAAAEHACTRLWTCTGASLQTG